MILRSSNLGSRSACSRTNSNIASNCRPPTSHRREEPNTSPRRKKARSSLYAIVVPGRNFCKIKRRLEEQFRDCKVFQKFKANATHMVLSSGQMAEITNDIYCAIASGIPIVLDSWVDESIKRRKFVDEEKHKDLSNFFCWSKDFRKKVSSMVWYRQGQPRPFISILHSRTVVVSEDNEDASDLQDLLLAGGAPYVERVDPMAYGIEGREDFFGGNLPTIIYVRKAAGFSREVSRLLQSNISSVVPFSFAKYALFQKGSVTNEDVGRYLSQIKVKEDIADILNSLIVDIQVKEELPFSSDSEAPTSSAKTNCLVCCQDLFDLKKLKELVCQNSDSKTADLSWAASCHCPVAEVKTALSNWNKNAAHSEILFYEFLSLHRGPASIRERTALTPFFVSELIRLITGSLRPDGKFRPRKEALRHIFSLVDRADLVNETQILENAWMLLLRVLKQFPPKSHDMRFYWMYTIADRKFVQTSSAKVDEPQLICALRRRVCDAFSNLKYDDNMRFFLVSLLEWDLCALLFEEKTAEEGSFAGLPLSYLLHFDLETRSRRHFFSADAVTAMCKWAERAIDCFENKDTLLNGEYYLRLITVSFEALRMHHMPDKKIEMLDLRGIPVGLTIDVERVVRAFLNRGLTADKAACLFDAEWMCKIAAETCK